MSPRVHAFKVIIFNILHIHVYFNTELYTSLVSFWLKLTAVSVLLFLVFFLTCSDSALCLHSTKIVFHGMS